MDAERLEQQENEQTRGLCLRLVRRAWKLRWWIVGLAAGTWLLVGALDGPMGLGEMHRRGRDRDALVKEIERLQALRRARSREVWLLQPATDETPPDERAAKEREIERRARRDQKMIRPGETVFMLPERLGPSGRGEPK